MCVSSLTAQPEDQGAIDLHHRARGDCAGANACPVHRLDPDDYQVNRGGHARRGGTGPIARRGGLWGPLLMQIGAKNF